MKSWRTSIFGALGVVAGAIVASDFGPMITKIAGCVGTMASGLGLLFARDAAASKKAAEMAAARNGGEVPIRRKLPLPVYIVVGISALVSSLIAQVRPMEGQIVPLFPGFSPVFLVTTIQLPGESMQFQFSENATGPWTEIAFWEALPVNSPPQFLSATAPGKWMAADGQIRGFVRVTGTLSPFP